MVRAIGRKLEGWDVFDQNTLYASVKFPNSNNFLKTTLQMRKNEGCRARDTFFVVVST